MMGPPSRLADTAFCSWRRGGRSPGSPEDARLGIRSIPAGARTATKAHPRGLTAREQQILDLLSQGQSNEEISASLFISVRTVEHHVSAILGKLGVTTRKGAAGEALKLGLIPSDRASVTTKSR
jgi:DNA-binding NarL/FixJ family response regulator